MRTRVKICGLTRVQDAIAAATLGVDAIGLVFYPPSPRNVSPERALKIIHALPAFIKVVGLFVDATVSKIQKTLDVVPIDCIQFHGDEAADACDIYNKPYLKAIKVKPGLDILACAKQYHNACAILLDTYHHNIKGGSGKQFDWDLIPSNCPLPIVLSGGLNIKNIKRAVCLVRPYAVDVSSGVELKRGIKDINKMTIFMQEIKTGDDLI